MHKISHQRCFNHENREAAALCPECSRFFCRECVTEHNGRVLCSECIANQANPLTLRSNFLSRTAHVALVLLGILTAWYCFFYTGQTLLGLPDNFHDGTFWKMEDPFK